MKTVLINYTNYRPTLASIAKFSKKLIINTVFKPNLFYYFVLQTSGEINCSCRLLDLLRESFPEARTMYFGCTLQ